MTDDILKIGPHTFRSRLMTGTGKCRNADDMNAALRRHQKSREP